MVSTCILCKTKTLSTDVSTHSFPKNPERRLLWLKAINRTTVSKNTKLCSKHFEARFFRCSSGSNMTQRRFLLPTAVPSLYLCSGSENNIEENNSQLIGCPKQINTSYTVHPTASEHRKIYNKSVLTLTEMRTFDTQDKLCNNEQMPLQNNMKMENIEEISNRMKYVEEGSKVNPDQNSIYKKTKEGILNNRKRSHSGHIGVYSKRMKYIGDIDWNVICHTPSLAMYHGIAAVKEIKTLRKELNVRTQQIRNMKRKISNLQSLLFELRQKDLIDYSSKQILSKGLNPLQEQIFNSLLKKVRPRSFPPSLRSFAGTLHFLSPKAYRYVRQTFIKCLPHPKTISKWYMSVDGSPGISKPALDAIQRNVNKAKGESNEIYCGLCVDDMSIFKHMEWNGKRLIGHIDYGTQLNNASLPEARYAMVIMAVALNMHWKIPVAYYFIDGLNGEQRSHLVSQAIVALHETGAHVVSITCDGASSNISMLNDLGADLYLHTRNVLHKNKRKPNNKRIQSMSNIVTNDQQKNNDNALFLSVENLKTYFPHPVTKENVWVMLDACHMIKLIRNTFDKQRLINAENKMISWKYLEELVLVQERHNLHVATKIRRRHLNWKQEKMKVKLAVQTLSTSVANALTYLDKECKMSQFKECDATAQFCLIMNDIFDVLNSRNKFCKTESQKCISKDNFLIIEEKIDNYIKYIVSLKNDENIPILLTERKIGFLGIIICLKSVVGICYQYILSLENKWDYLLTYKMSQDHLELYFSAIRSRGGHNNNPTCRQFQTAFKQLLVHCEIGGSEYANSVPQDTTSFLHASSLIKKDESIDELIDSIPHTNDHEYANVSAEHSYANSDNETYINCNSVYIDDVVSYIAGFIVKSIKSKISCDICSKMLVCESTISSLQKIKSRGKLINASLDVIRLCKIAETSFRCYDVFKNYQKPLIQILCQDALKRIPNNIFINNNHMFHQGILGDHRYQIMKCILKKYFSLRMHHECDSLKNTIHRIRNKHTKIILFKNQ